MFQRYVVEVMEFPAVPAGTAIDALRVELRNEIAEQCMPAGFFGLIKEKVNYHVAVHVCEIGRSEPHGVERPDWFDNRTMPDTLENNSTRLTSKSGCCLVDTWWEEHYAATSRCVDRCLNGEGVVGNTVTRCPGGRYVVTEIRHTLRIQHAAGAPKKRALWDALVED